MKQIRLEALRLAVQSGSDNDTVIKLAGMYSEFINNGEKIVEIQQTPSKTENTPAQEIVGKGHGYQQRSRKTR